jgi:ribosome maturation factor RimP
MTQALEQKISEIIESTVNSLGFELVKLALTGVNSKVLEILIDKLDHSKVTIADCRQVSRNISTLLDVEDVITDEYSLEVSSCGVERPLVKFNDYVRFVNSEVKIKLKEQVNGRLKYQGVIMKAEDNNIELKPDQEELVLIPYDIIKNAKLVLTDKMFRELLNKS